MTAKLVKDDTCLFGFSTTEFVFLNRPSNVTNGEIYTTQVFRDPSAWYHFVLAIDTTQATASNRIKIYVNGSQITALRVANYPSQNSDLLINSTEAHNIGRFVDTATTYFDGYLTEINFIDGQALTPSSFGLNDPETGVWSPKRYTGTYGTNGFYVNFSDNSGTTSTTLGKDYSGNGNNWTPNNFSVTAGAGNDSLVDSPTAYGTDTGVGGEVRGNYCVLNPLAYDRIYPSFKATLSNGNLQAVTSSGGTGDYSATIGTIGVSAGKWYWEMTGTAGTTLRCFGITDATLEVPSYPGGSARSWGYYSGGRLYNNSSFVSYGATWTTNDVIGVALDLDAGTLVFYKNGVSQGTAATGLSGTFTPILSDLESGVSSTIVCNFGQRAFAYTAPSGFKALCTTNLPTPTIGATSTTQANDYFNAVTYTGNGSTQSITGVGFQPDFVWIKDRSAVTFHVLFDAIRGVQKYLVSNNTDAEGTLSTTLTAFNSDGFTYGTNGSGNALNDAYVAWNWNAGGSNATNTAGTITSTVRANTTSGFSIVTYTGTGANATVGHGLGVAPQMVIVKARDDAESWKVYHASTGGAVYQMVLNSTAARASVSTIWNSTDPTTSVFSIGTDSSVNQNTEKFVAYCFAPVAGYSAFGSYTGNGSADGPFVYTGFIPRWIMLKASSTTSGWLIIDTSRQNYNVEGPYLVANASDAETTGTTVFDVLSNGFKMRSSSTLNTSSATYIYAAFAESPFKYALAR
jgi:hypothetical protein